MGSRSDIRNVKVVCKYGAFGKANAQGFWIYGKRPDGKTVPCKNQRQADGSMLIWSERYDDGPYVIEDVTEFSASEWELIRKSKPHLQKIVGNKILDSREK